MQTAQNFSAVLRDIRDDEDAHARAERLRTIEQDTAAAVARRSCFPETHVAINLIAQVPQMFEADALCLLHAISRRIATDYPRYLTHWHAVRQELDGVQYLLDEVLTEQRAEYERTRGEPDPDAWYDQRRDDALAERMGGT
jgi:hypothetical protein